MVRVIFICSSLEPSRDGVGDYVRRVGGELIRQGNSVSALALNDNHVVGEWHGDQDAEGTSFPVIRLPANWSANRRFEIAKQYVQQFNPQWISLQYVPFGFHKKGLPFGLDKKLKSLGEGRQWHIMFHELWVGMEKKSSYRYIAWGYVQRMLIYNLIVILKPKVIHTQTRLYQLQLQQIGFKVDLLPLPSNIPACFRSDILLNEESSITFVLFGAVHPRAPFIQFAKEVGIYAKKTNTKATLVIVGWHSDDQKAWVDAWEAEGLSAKLVGEQPADSISEFLIRASYGVATTPMALIEKSGSVAAMLEHGLPVICVSRQWQPKISTHTKDSLNITEYIPGILESYLSIKRERHVPSHIQIANVASKLIDCFSPHNING